MPIGNRVTKIASVLIGLLVLAAVASATTTTTATTKSKHTQAASHSSSAKSKNTQLASTHSSSRHHSSKHASKTPARSHGQHSIDEERTRAIQTALIREHYLTGEPTGTWDEESKEAMVRYQAANGWQTKITPDSRALIKLGLGPDHKGLLNPETANIASPHELGIDSQTQPGGAADPQ